MSKGVERYRRYVLDNSSDGRQNLNQRIFRGFRDGAIGFERLAHNRVKARECFGICHLESRVYQSADDEPINTVNTETTVTFPPRQFDNRNDGKLEVISPKSFKEIIDKLPR